MPAKRIIARFTPQAWINDYAVDIDGAYDFDVTAQILAMPKEQALTIEDDSYEADDLWHENAVSNEKPHGGPFCVTVQQAIADYFREPA